MAKKTDEGINSYPDLFDTGLALEAMLVTLIDAGVFEQLPMVERDESRLEEELQAAIELGMACDRFACAA
jgi:hypothetical protein